MSTQSESAARILGHMARAYLVSLQSHRKLSVAGPAQWCVFLEQCSRQMIPAMRPVVVPLLKAFSDRAQGLGNEERLLAGLAARRTLEFAWRHETRDRWTVLNAMIAVCRSFDSDPAASGKLLRCCLVKEHLELYGHEEMPHLAGELGQLVPIDPAFVGDVYRAVLSYEELSDDETSMGSGRILRMVSNRKQDYRGAIYSLAKTFRPFMTQAPVEATRAMIAAIDAYIARSAFRPEEIPVEMIVVGERTAHLASDCSQMWDNGSEDSTNPLPAMLNRFEEQLRRLSDQPEGGPIRAQMLDLIITDNRYAAVWRRVIACAVGAPHTLGQEVRSLAWSVPILKGFEFQDVIGQFLTALFPTLSPVERQKVEEAILSIGNAENPEDRIYAENDRDSLLRHLSPSDLVTDPAKRRIAELGAASSAVQPILRPYPEHFGRDFSELGLLANEGVPVNALPNRTIREIAAPLKSFIGAHLNIAPTIEEMETILPAVRSLREALRQADADGVHPAQKDACWSTLAAACACLTHVTSFTCNKPEGTLVCEVLLEAAVHPLPSPPEQAEEGFPETVAWKHTPRGDAADGLTRMCSVTSCCQDNVLAAVECLARDPVALVRFRVVEQLPSLKVNGDGLFWRILKSLGHEERNLHVLLKALTTISRLASDQLERVAPIVLEVFKRTQQVPKAEKVRIACLELCMRIESNKGDAFGGKILALVLADVGTHAAELDYLIKAVASQLVSGSVEHANLAADTRRRRTVRLFEQIAAAAVAEIRRLRQRFPSGPPESEQERVKGVFSLCESLSLWVYFSSGADDEKQYGGPKYAPLERNVKLRFLRETEELFDLIATMPDPQAIHNLLQVLENYVPIDPRAVFLRVGRVVRAGRQVGYEFESMAADLVVCLVQRYLAEYRQLFRDYPDCLRTLMDLLDAFIQAGWPSAFRLTYDLEDLFR